MKYIILFLLAFIFISCNRNKTKEVPHVQRGKVGNYDMQYIITTDETGITFDPPGALASEGDMQELVMLTIFAKTINTLEEIEDVNLEPAELKKQLDKMNSKDEYVYLKGTVYSYKIKYGMKGNYVTDIIYKKTYL